MLPLRPWDVGESNDDAVPPLVAKRGNACGAAPSGGGRGNANAVRAMVVTKDNAKGVCPSGGEKKLSQRGVPSSGEKKLCLRCSIWWVVKGRNANEVTHYLLPTPDGAPGWYYLISPSEGAVMPCCTRSSLHLLRATVHCMQYCAPCHGGSGAVRGGG